MKTLWPGIAVAIIVILCFLLIRQCKSKSNPADTTQTAMDAIKAGYDSAKKEDLPVIASLVVVKDSLTGKIDTLTKSLVLAQQDLQTRAGDIAQTLVSGDRARIVHDTAWIVRNCDSLRAEVNAGLPVVQGAIKLSDSLIAVHVARGKVQDSIIVRQQHLIAVGDTTITAQRIQFDILHKDNMTKTVQLKFYKPVAIGGVAVVAAIIVLKFITK